MQTQPARPRPPRNMFVENSTPQETKMVGGTRARAVMYTAVRCPRCMYMLGQQLSFHHSGITPSVASSRHGVQALEFSIYFQIWPDYLDRYLQKDAAADRLSCRPQHRLHTCSPQTIYLPKVGGEISEHQQHSTAITHKDRARPAGGDKGQDKRDANDRSTYRPSLVKNQGQLHRVLERHVSPLPQRRPRGMSGVANKSGVKLVRAATGHEGRRGRPVLQAGNNMRCGETGGLSTQHTRAHHTFTTS